MPNIKIFDTPALGLRPTETGIETFAGNARRMGAFFNQQAGALSELGAEKGAALRTAGNAVGGGIQAAGDAAVNYLDHKEISAGAAKGTELMSTLTDAWNQKISDPKLDPNDPTIKQQFMQEQLEPALQQFKSDSGFFTTEKSQQFAEQFIEHFRQHMENKTAADMSTLAGIALKTNVATTVNSLSSMVASDPSSLEFALQSADHAIGAKVSSSPNLDATTAASVRSEVGLKAKEAIVKSAVIGMIQKNPGVDLDAIQKKYGDYINGAEMKMFQKTAQVQARSDAAMAKQELLLKKQVADQNMHAGSNQIIADNVTIDPQSGRPIINPKFFQQTLDLARKNPDAPSAASTVRTMLDWAESQQNRETRHVDDPAIVKGLTDRMFDPANPTTEIDLMRAQTQGKLSDHTYTQLGGMVKQLQETPLKGPIYQDTMKAVHGSLVLNVPGIPGKDDKGEQNYASFVQSFIPQYLAKFREGSLPPNALDIKDPNSMISQAMAPFKRTASQRMQDYVSSIGGLASDTKRISTKAEYDALPVGTVYISAKDGQKYEKR